MEISIVVYSSLMGKNLSLSACACACACACVCVCVCVCVCAMLIRSFSGVTCALKNMKIKHRHEITNLQNITSQSFSVTPAYLDHNTHEVHDKLQDFISQSVLIYDRGIGTHFLLLTNELSEAPEWVHPAPLVSHRLQFRS